MSRFQFVADHRDTFEVKRLCQTVEVSRSSFYAWERAAVGRAERAAADAALAEQIKAVQSQDRAYGAPRVTAELDDGATAEERVNHKRVARVMREHHLPGLRLRRRVRTTVPEPADGDNTPTREAMTSHPRMLRAHRSRRVVDEPGHACGAKTIQQPWQRPTCHRSAAPSRERPPCPHA